MSVAMVDIWQMNMGVQSFVKGMLVGPGPSVPLYDAGDVRHEDVYVHESWRRVKMSMIFL